MSKASAYKSRLIEQKKYKKVPHIFNKKICHWLYCSGCGLVLLKNDATERRVAQGCESMED